MDEPDALKRTPLCETHRSAGAKMVPFGGWEMPVYFSSILEEHDSVRHASGLFDISHMGEFFISGPGSETALNHLLTNDTSRLADGAGQYSLLLNEQGGVIDDLIVYRLAQDRYFAVVNASKIDEDFAWMQRTLPPGVLLENRSSRMCGLALQGPKFRDILRATFEGVPLPNRFHVAGFDWRGSQILIARTGYTGEDGVELFGPSELAEPLWRALIDAGTAPCGLGSRDSLRLEACYPLNGSDLGPDITPLEAGLGFAVAFDKPGGFSGIAPLLHQRAKGIPRKLVAFQTDRSAPPPRAHYPLFDGDQSVGEVSSGGFSPTIKTGVGLGLVTADCAKVGKHLEMEVRGRRVPIVIAKKPHYKSASL